MVQGQREPETVPFFYELHPVNFSNSVKLHIIAP